MKNKDVKICRIWDPLINNIFSATRPLVPREKLCFLVAEEKLICNNSLIVHLPRTDGKLRGSGDKWDRKKSVSLRL